MADSRYQSPLRGVGVTELPNVMKRAIKAVERELPPKTGVIVFAFDFNAGTGDGAGMAYIANGQRDDCIAALEEWITKQRNARN